MSIYRDRVTVPASGAAGSASGTLRTSRLVEGRVLAIHISYGGAPTSTDVAITEAGNDPAQPVLTISNANADGWFYPLAQAVDQSGATLSGQGAPIYTADYLAITVTGANDADSVTVSVIWSDR